MRQSLADRILELEDRIKELPRGTLTYKNINGRPQPYLQWHENGRLRSRYIKVKGRETVLSQIEERRRLQDELISCLAQYYKAGTGTVRDAGILHEYKASPGSSGPGANRVGADSGRHGERNAGPDAEHRLMPPVGISWYPDAVTDAYYVDKTLMIRDLLNEKTGVRLFTRPRRFGKTLNMTMLRTFFEHSVDEDRSVFFRDKAIWSCGEKYTSQQGIYPVIYITFKDVRTVTWSDTREYIERIIIDEYSRHSELKTSASCEESERLTYERIVSGNANTAELTGSLRLLSRMLFAHHGIRPIILIDEYDTPVQNGYIRGFYDEVITFMRMFFSEGLKDNENMTFAVMTGILRVAKESLFSGMNNLRVYSVLDDRYSEYFGFTADEVRRMAGYYDAAGRYNEICEWYDGYRFGDKDIFNPWSVANYFSAGCKADAYWLSTSSNEIINRLLEDADPEIHSNLLTLLDGEALDADISFNVIYPELSSSPDSIYSFLLVTGYLKAMHTENIGNGEYSCRLALPNKELFGVYRSEIIRRAKPLFARSSASAITLAIRRGQPEKLAEELRRLLERSSSYYNTVGELYYQGLLLGLLAAMDNCYHVREDRESGRGRYDFALIPRKNDLPGVIVEIKYHKGTDADELKALSRTALDQISELKYETELRELGVTRILKYGVAFSGKQTEVAMSIDKQI